MFELVCLHCSPASPHRRGGASQGRVALVARRNERNLLNGAFLFGNFFFCAFLVKRKSGLTALVVKPL